MYAFYIEDPSAALIFNSCFLAFKKLMETYLSAKAMKLSKFNMLFTFVFYV